MLSVRSTGIKARHCLAFLWGLNRTGKIPPLLIERVLECIDEPLVCCPKPQGDKRWYLTTIMLDYKQIKYE